ncbi:retrovirus-related pol polyprotein from transposon TNT 1-94 [Tanacetum coccineum]
MLFTMPSWKQVVKTVHQCLHLKQGESINVQDLETNLYWEFEKFTSREGESLESYYSRFYKMMNELVRNQRDGQELKTVSYYKLYDILKQHQNEVNKIRAERLARTANPLALDNTSRINRGTRYDNQRVVNIVRAKENVDTADNYGPIFDVELLQKVQNDDDNYNVFANDKEHPEQLASVNVTYMKEHGDTNITTDSLDMSNNRGEADQDEDKDLAREHDLLASLINKLKCEIYDIKNYLKKFQAELDRYHDVNYASKVEIECAKAKEMKKELFAHQETISIILQEKEAQNKFHKTREDKELEKTIALENKIKVLYDIVYKTGQSVQTMNMPNRNCKTIFVKPEFLKKAQRANPRLYDIDLKAKLQDKDIAISELKKLIEKMKTKSVETKFEKPSVIRQPNAFKSQRQSVLGVIPTTSVSKPQLKSNQLEDRVMHNNIQGKNQQVEEHSRNFKFSNNKTFITACNFGTDKIAPILGYRDLVQGNVTIKRVYYVEGLNHTLFSVGRFCDADLEVDFWKSTCYIRDLKGNDLLTGKAKCKSFKTKTTPSLKRRLQILRMDLCGPMGVESLNGKKYVLVIVDDYSRFTWTYFLRSKDETPEVFIDFLKLDQRGLHAQVRTVRTDKGTNFLNKTLLAYFAQEGIEHQTPFNRTPEQNGIAKRWNHALVEAAQTMLSAAKVPWFFWAEEIATSYGENIHKMKGNGDSCIFVGYSTQSRAYRVYNKRTRVIVETIHVNFDELPLMASDHGSFDPIPQCLTTALEQDKLSPGPQSQENVPQAVETVTMSNEMDLLFSLMFDELLNGTTLVVSKSSAVTTDDAPDQRQ